MEEAPKRQAITFELEYSSPFEEGELAEVRAVLEEFGAVRMRPLHIPQAGPEILRIVIAFVGVSALQGLIGQYAVNVVHRVAERLRCTGRGAPHPLASRITRATVSFDDLDVHVALPREAPMDRLADLLIAVRDRMAVPPPSAEPTQLVVFPAVQDEDGRWRLWNANLDGDEADLDRYWLLDVRDASGACRIYDARTGREFTGYPHEEVWRYRGRQPRPMLMDPLEEAISRLRPHLSRDEARELAARVAQLAEALNVAAGPHGTCPDRTVESLLSLCERADSGDLWPLLGLAGNPACGE